MTMAPCGAMKRTTAEMLNALMLKIARELDESLRAVEQTEAEEVFKKYRSTVAEILGTTLMQVMNPIYAHYPHLEPMELRSSGRPDKARAFHATHRLQLPGAETVELMLYDPAGGFAHTKQQWTAFQAGECIEKPFWQRLGGRWWRDNDDVHDQLMRKELESEPTTGLQARHSGRKSD